MRSCANLLKLNHYFKRVVFWTEFPRGWSSNVITFGCLKFLSAIKKIPAHFEAGGLRQYGNIYCCWGRFQVLVSIFIIFTTVDICFVLSRLFNTIHISRSIKKTDNWTCILLYTSKTRWFETGRKCVLFYTSKTRLFERDGNVYYIALQKPDGLRRHGNVYKLHTL